MWHQYKKLPDAIATLVGCLLLAVLLAASSNDVQAANVDRVTAPPAPAKQSEAQALAKSKGCASCHTKTDQSTMHASPAVKLGCTDCHGGNAAIERPARAQSGSGEYRAAIEKAHVLPRYPDDWKYPSSANPERSYTLLNREAPEYIRFVNPSDFRIAREACGACHLRIIEAAERSLMATGAMLWGGASYNNGILPFKNYILGEAYTRDGEPAVVAGPKLPNPDEAAKKFGVLPQLRPLPAWETVMPGDIFRVFERGGRNISPLFPEIGLPNVAGQIQRLEEPGRPDTRQSTRGPGTGARIAVPLINIHKTRLNDPFTWFLGTNDQPGDYRSSGCASCHVVYANDREPRHSSQYAPFGNQGKTQTVDPTIPKDERGHPLQHAFTRSIPSSQCMVCHMHQPNVFVNSYLGYTMWDYESDAPAMWPEKQKYPTDAEIRRVNDRNPEGAAPRGKWADPQFLEDVWTKINPTLKDSQFADYHGHGWNFRAVFKRDRVGNLLDADNRIVADNDPDKFKKAVHLSSIHLDKGMHCADCHYAQDNHGTGHVFGEVGPAIEIECVDCHGTVDRYPTLRTSGPASPNGGTDVSVLRNPDGRKRFEWRDGKLFQRSVVDQNLEWEVKLVKNSVDKTHRDYNAKAARAKLMSRDKTTFKWGLDVAPNDRAHKDENMECYACHLSWTTSCGGCHLPIEANWKTGRHHYEGGETRNYATYNPQVVRDDMFMLGRRGKIDGGRIAPVRSSSALVLSSTNANREKIYIQQPPIAASGFSSQAFNPHYPHTERKTETKTCTDCHLSAENDNNAIMAQLLLQGTNFINFVGHYAWVGTEGSVTGVQVTEWDEPQAVIGSYLHRYAYPDRFSQHIETNRDWYKLQHDNRQVLKSGESHKAGRTGCLQLRGEYLYAANGPGGMQVFDVANIANKGFSQRIVTAPASGLGQDTRIRSANATCVALPTNQPIHPDRNQGELMRDKNQEWPFHPIYNYAFITDSEEGLILTDVNTLADGNPRNNFLKRALTWNENGVLDGARHITIGGYYVYVMADKGLVILNLDKPLAPKVEAVVPLKDGRASALQFRYLWVTEKEGLKTVDVTDKSAPRLVPNNLIALKDAKGLYLARTYAYVAAGSEGLAIVDITRPEKMKLFQMYTANGRINDARDVVVATTNASLFAYVADGSGGLKVVQLTSPELQPKFYGFSPAPNPSMIAWCPMPYPALSLSKGLDRDRGVDETGNQIAVFGRLGSSPLTLQDMERLYLDVSRKPWFVRDDDGEKSANR